MTYRTERDTETKFDWVTVFLVIALIATIGAFYAGIFLYPYGWIVLSLLLVFWLSANRKRVKE